METNRYITINQYSYLHILHKFDVFKVGVETNRYITINQ